MSSASSSALGLAVWAAAGLTVLDGPAVAEAVVLDVGDRSR